MHLIAGFPILIVLISSIILMQINLLIINFNFTCKLIFKIGIDIKPRNYTHSLVSRISS